MWFSFQIVFNYFTWTIYLLCRPITMNSIFCHVWSLWCVVVVMCRENKGLCSVVFVLYHNQVIIFTFTINGSSVLKMNLSHFSHSRWFSSPPFHMCYQRLSHINLYVSYLTLYSCNIHRSVTSCMLCCVKEWSPWNGNRSRLCLCLKLPPHSLDKLTLKLYPKWQTWK